MSTVQQHQSYNMTSAIRGFNKYYQAINVNGNAGISKDNTQRKLLTQIDADKTPRDKKTYEK